MKSSSSSTRSRAGVAWYLVGLAALGAGCSRAPVPARPTTVYVDASSLARSHPKWDAVTALDNEIAWLSAYRVRPVAPPSGILVDTSVPLREAAQVDMAALTERIETTLEDVRQREHGILKRRLERERRLAQADVILAKRHRLTDEAEQRFQAVLDRYGLELANMLVQLTAVTALERTYAARSSAWESLATEMRERRLALDEQIATTKDRRTAEVLGVFAWLEAQFDQAANEETANALEWIRTHRSQLDALDQRVDEQKSLLLEALRRVAPPSAVQTASVASGLSSADVVPTPTALPPLPEPNLEGRIATLRERRATLVGFILQNTRATVKAAARADRNPVEPVFEKTTAALPDRTEQFRPVVRDPAAELQRRTRHGAF